MAKTTKTGHRVEPLSNEELADQVSNFRGYESGLVRLHPDRWLFFPSAPSIIDKIYEFEFRPTDVIVMTYPKCGTTWMQEIVWTMRENPNLESPSAKKPINFRCPFLEADMLRDSATRSTRMEEELGKAVAMLNPNIGKAQVGFLTLAEVTREPRTFKTHLPFSLLHPDTLEKCKVVYVVRNPLDVCASYLHHSRIVKRMSFVGSVDTFVDLFIKDNMLFGSYWKHIQEMWQRRNHPNLMFLFYENMIKSPFPEYKKLDTFLGTNLSEDQVKKIVDYTNFEKMRERDNVMGSSHTPLFNASVVDKEGGFFRKGKARYAKDDLTEEQRKKVTDWSKTFLDTFDEVFRSRS